MAEPRVVVVGAGIGGLVAALLLAQRGLRVQVVDAGPLPGGKMRRHSIGGRPIDTGPTVLTMRWIFERIFQEAGSTLEDHVSLTPLQVLARHAAAFPKVDAFTVAAVFGGWTRAQREHFDAGAVYDQIVAAQAR